MSGSGSGEDRPRDDDEAFRRIVFEGARLFDDGHFFEAHEAWEKGWLAEKDEMKRRLLQGLIQIAAGLHKLIEKNAADSAMRLLTKGLAKIDACNEAWMSSVGLVARFREGIRSCINDLEAGTYDHRKRIPKLHG